MWYLWVNTADRHFNVLPWVNLLWWLFSKPCTNTYSRPKKRVENEAQCIAQSVMDFASKEKQFLIQCCDIKFHALAKKWLNVVLHYEAKTGGSIVQVVAQTSLHAGSPDLLTQTSVLYRNARAWSIVSVLTCNRLENWKPATGQHAYHPRTAKTVLPTMLCYSFFENHPVQDWLGQTKTNALQ